MLPLCILIKNSYNIIISSVDAQAGVVTTSPIRDESTGRWSRVTLNEDKLFDPVKEVITIKKYLEIKWYI